MNKYLLFCLLGIAIAVDEEYRKLMDLHNEESLSPEMKEDLDAEDFKYFMKNADDENAIPEDKYGKLAFLHELTTPLNVMTTVTQLVLQLRLMQNEKIFFQIQALNLCAMGIFEIPLTIGDADDIFDSFTNNAVDETMIEAPEDTYSLSGEPLLDVNGNDKKDRDAQNAFNKANKIIQGVRAWIRAQRRKMFG